MRNIPDKLNAELDNLEQEATLLFYVIDVSDKYSGEQVYRFVNSLNENSAPVVWQGNTYEPLPSTIDGISFGNESDGAPTFAVSNVLGLMTGLIIKYDDLVGCKLHLKIVNVKFLDAVNFKFGNVNADPNQETAITYIINKINQVNSQVATFELAVPGDNYSAMLPKGVITASNCRWKYRGIGCGYSGSNYFDYKNKPVSSYELDECNHQESGCKCRFGENATLPIGCFLAVDKLSS